MRAAALALAGLTGLAGPLLVVAPAPAAAPETLRCPAGSTVVAKAPLLTEAGVRIGALRVSLRQDGRYCGELRRAAKYADTAFIGELEVTVSNATYAATSGTGGQGGSVPALTTGAVSSGERVRYRGSLRGTSLQGTATVRVTVP